MSLAQTPDFAMLKVTPLDAHHRARSQACPCLRKPAPSTRAEEICKRLFINLIDWCHREPCPRNRLLVRGFQASEEDRKSMVKKGNWQTAYQPLRKGGLFGCGLGRLPRLSAFLIAPSSALTRWSIPFP